MYSLLLCSINLYAKDTTEKATEETDALNWKQLKEWKPMNISHVRVKLKWSEDAEVSSNYLKLIW